MLGHGNRDPDRQGVIPNPWFGDRHERGPGGLERLEELVQGRCLGRTADTGELIGDQGIGPAGLHVGKGVGEARAFGLGAGDTRIHMDGKEGPAPTGHLGRDGVALGIEAEAVAGLVRGRDPNVADSAADLARLAGRLGQPGLLRASHGGVGTLPGVVYRVVKTKRYIAE